MRQIFTVFLLLILPVFAQAFDTAARSAYVIDVSTGAVMFDKNSDAAMPPASMSKLMTVEIAFRALKEGKVTLDTPFIVSEKAWEKGGSKMFVELGSSIPLGDILQGIIVQSGNDACIVLAEGFAGSEDKFAELMNLRAAELGLKDSVFANSSGWPDPNQRMSARDLANLAYHISVTYPEYMHYFSQSDYTYNNITQANRNPLLGSVEGAIGFKTGHTEEAGYGLVGSVKRGGRHIVFVLMGLETQAQRTDEALRVSSWALEGFTANTQARAGETIIEVPVWMGAASDVALSVEKDFVTLDPIAGVNAAKMTAVFDSPIPAPITKGDLLGQILVEPADGPAYEVPLVAAEDVARGGFFQRYAQMAMALMEGQLASVSESAAESN